jgi:glycerophosphoryl diester phosphodiesterase
MVKHLCVAILVAGCSIPAPHYEVVHHRANGCDGLAPENSLQGARCIVDQCARGAGPCALEGDARIALVRGGSLGGDREILWLHDGSSKRTAHCPTGDISLPGERPVDKDHLGRCRLVRYDGTPTEEIIPTLDDIIALVTRTEVKLFLEIKTIPDAAMDDALVDGVLSKVAPIESHVVLASFSLRALGRAKRARPSVPTACFAPSGALLRQISRVVAGGIAEDVDGCLDAGHDYVFVPPSFVDGSIVSHVRALHARLGVYGSETQTAFDQIEAWRHRIDVVYADHPKMYWPLPN